MSELKQGLYLKYESQAGYVYRTRIADFCFDGERWVKASNDIAPIGKMFVLLCKCGSNDWIDNGRFTNEYECNGCGQFVSVCCYESKQIEIRKKN